VAGRTPSVAANQSVAAGAAAGTAIGAVTGAVVDGSSAPWQAPAWDWC